MNTNKIERAAVRVVEEYIDGKWSFAPAYDLCYSYNPAGRWTSRHQLSLNSKTDDFAREDLLAVAQNIGIRDANHIKSYHRGSSLHSSILA